MRFEFSNEQNWHSRGYLPHYDATEKYQMITYRLADSLPQGILSGSAECNSASTDNYEAKLNRRRSIETLLDQGYGSCILAREECAEIVVQAWKYFDNERYDLKAYVVMPNHVHLMVKTYKACPVGDLVKSWKSFSVKKIRSLYQESFKINTNEVTPDILSSGNPFWQREYWDRFIRDEKHFHSAIDYIHNNPVKAGLCENADDWRWSSAGKSN